MKKILTKETAPMLQFFLTFHFPHYNEQQKVEMRIWMLQK